MIGKETVSMYGIMWLIICIILVIVEVATLNLTTIWFAIGGFIAYLTGFVGAGFWGQFFVFVIVSLIMLFFTRPVARRYLNKGRVKTNAESLVGQIAKTTSCLNNREGFGSAVINGQEWSAISSDDKIIIEEGEDVEILEVRGVKLVVRKAIAPWKPEENRK